MVTKNLGLVKAIHTGSTAPTNTMMLWYNTTTNKHYAYSSVSLSWKLLANADADFGAIQDVDIDAEYTLAAGRQNFIYGDMTVEGTFHNEGMIVVQDGDLIIDGDVDGDGDIEFI